jgi:EpsI family protein
MREETLIARHRLLVVNSILLLALLGSHWACRIQETPVGHRDFLSPLCLPFRDWAASDHKLLESERELLQPDAALIRRYQSRDGESVELAVIAGRRKQTVHNPGFCMAGGGWETVSQERIDISLPDRKLPATRSVMIAGNRQLLATYFFTDGEYSSHDLIQFQAVQLLKRVRGESALGALVRILVPLHGDRASAARLSDDFARVTLPDVMRQLSRSRSDRQ